MQRVGVRLDQAIESSVARCFGGGPVFVGWQVCFVDLAFNGAFFGVVFAFQLIAGLLGFRDLLGEFVFFFRPSLDGWYCRDRSFGQLSDRRWCDCPASKVQTLELCIDRPTKDLDVFDKLPRFALLIDFEIALFLDTFYGGDDERIDRRRLFCLVAIDAGFMFRKSIFQGLDGAMLFIVLPRELFDPFLFVAWEACCIESGSKPIELA